MGNHFNSIHSIIHKVLNQLEHCQWHHMGSNNNNSKEDMTIIRISTHHTHNSNNNNHNLSQLSSSHTTKVNILRNTTGKCSSTRRIIQMAMVYLVIPLLLQILLISLNPNLHQQMHITSNNNNNSQQVMGIISKQASKQLSKHICNSNNSNKRKIFNI